MISAANLLASALLMVCVSSAAADPLDLDFNNDPGEWRVVVDGVMGGRSVGRVARNEPGVLEFSGDLSLDNNGGFSQIRHGVAGDQFIGMRGIEITVRGDGRSYNFDVRCANARVLAGGFQQAFPTGDGRWTTIRLAFKDFRLYSFGQPVASAPAIVPTMIESIGFTLSDKQEGAFRLDIASIRAFGDSTDPVTASDPDITTLSRRSTLDRLRALVKADVQASAPGAVAATARTETVRLITLAIDRGTPLFNNGQPAACAAVYEVTIEAVVVLGADDLQRPVIERLQKGLAETKAARNASQRAWILRRALDDTYTRLTR